VKDVTQPVNNVISQLVMFVKKDTLKTQLNLNNLVFNPALKAITPLL
jgi:hypothetical protein